MYSLSKNRTMVVVKPVHLMPVLCPAPDAIIALQTASLQPFLTNQAGILLTLSGAVSL